MTGDQLWRVEAPHFVAGLEVAQDGDITNCAPIIRWAGGWTFAAFHAYCGRKGWKMERVDA